ncbi:MAG: adenosine deaminase [Erysipelotrichaceae bacterium]|nr:adenosine deaminase [Erysipelotrichaceae bacterium]
MNNYDFPKVDLHLHLDGSFRIETMYELAKERGIEVPGGTLEAYGEWMEEHSNAKDVNDYLQMFDPPTAVMKDRDSIIRITKELIEDIAKQGLRYAEIRFAPQLHLGKGLSQRDAIEAVLEGKRIGEAENPSIKIGIICCMMCIGTEKVNYDANMETATIIKDYLDKGVVALDLAGAEGIVPLSNFKPFFDVAQANNVPCICHAGDSQDWRTCKDAIDMNVLRLGHGHHIYENPELSRLAAKKGIALEICPTSNVQCKTRESFKMHPAYNLYKLGIPVTINTDNMVMARTNVDREYDHCIEEMGFEYNDIIKMNINSFKVSFADEEYKKEMIAILESKLQ